MPKKVAIIGGGMSGLISAKYTIENGLEPTVFELTNHLGGLWCRDNKTAIWKGLFANVSKYSLSYHDHPWPDSTPIFCTADMVYQYLLDYAERFNLKNSIKYQTKVEHVKQLENKKWEIKLFDLKSHLNYTQVFDFLIVASGQHAKPRKPEIKNSNKFNGIQIHSSEYELNDSKLKNKRVVVVGCSVSGAEIAASLVGHAKFVISLISRTYFVTSRLVKFKQNGKNKILPCFLYLHRRSFHYTDLSPEEALKVRQEALTDLFPYQTNKEKSHPDLYIDLSQPNQEILIAFSDYYTQYVREGKIKPIKSKIKELEEKYILLDNGDSIECDAIVYCTGYEINTSFFDQEVINKMKYSDKDHKFPVILYKYTFHPDLENIGFNCQLDGILTTGQEIQADWISRVFSGKINLPNRQVMIDEMKKDEERRNENRRAQFPYGNHMVLVDDIARASGRMPDFNEIKKQDSRLYDILWNSPMFCCHYFLDNELSLKLIEQVYQMYNREYEFEKDDVSPDDIARKFSKYYKLPSCMLKTNI